jgi:hypothetical protein
MTDDNTDSNAPLRAEDAPRVRITAKVREKYTERHGGDAHQAVDSIREMLASVLATGTWKKSGDIWRGHNDRYHIGLLMTDQRPPAVIGYREGGFSPGGARKTSSVRSHLQVLVETELDRLPMPVTREALGAYARIITGQKLRQSTARLVFLRLRKDLSEGVIPEWMPSRHHTERMVVSYNGLLWQIERDPAARREGTVIRVAPEERGTF